MRESVLGSRRWEMLSVARALRRNERKEMKGSSGAWTLQTLLAMASTGSLDRSRPNTIVKWVAFHWKGNLCNATADLGFPCSPHPRASLQRPRAWKVLYPTLQSHQQGTGEGGGGFTHYRKKTDWCLHWYSPIESQEYPLVILRKHPSLLYHTCSPSLGLPCPSLFLFSLPCVLIF